MQVTTEKVKAADGGPAFPRVRLSVGATQSVSEEGMSLRDWFAGQALAGPVSARVAGMDASAFGKLGGFDWAVKCAYVCADAMLAEREK